MRLFARVTVLTATALFVPVTITSASAATTKHAYVADVDAQPVSCDQKYPTFAVDAGPSKIKVYYGSNRLQEWNSATQRSYTTELYEFKTPLRYGETVSAQVKVVGKNYTKRFTLSWKMPSAKACGKHKPCDHHGHDNTGRDND